MFVLDKPERQIPHTGRSTAIVTIVIGKDYQATWMRLSQKSWLGYAEANGFDLIAITYPFDTSARAAARSPAWQKLLILNQPWSRQYERIIWLDSDIIIGPFAQNIIQAAGPVEKVGVTLNGGRSSDSERMLFLERQYKTPILPEFEQDVWARAVQKNYASHRVELHDTMFNTGVLVLSPQHHNELFLRCYEGEDFGGRLYEQPLLSHEILQRDLSHPISTRFNWGIQEALFLYLPEIIDLENQPPALVEPVLKLARFLVRRELQNAYFLHFYGTMGLMMTLTEEDVFGGDPVDLFLQTANQAAPAIRTA
jgi:hypothetical protein